MNNFEMKKPILESEISSTLSTKINNKADTSYVDTLVSNVTNGYTTCKSLGMVANDSTDAIATANYNKICTAINSSIKLLIDDKYYILPTTNGTAITSGRMDIEGNTSNAELIISPTKTGEYIMFTSAVDFSIRLNNFKFTSNVRLGTDFTTTGGETQILRVTTAIRISSIDVTQMKFYNRMRLITYALATEPDPSTFGIDYIKFNYNQCYNIASQNYGMFVLLNTPVTYAEIKYNRILNFANSFYNNGISVVTTADALALASKTLIVEHNDVKVEDTWITPTVGCGVSLGQYHCFILSEGVDVYYEYNKVEGLHTFDDACVVYDAYLSSTNVYYRYNKWKNNICFDSTVGYNTLFKAKFGTGIRECMGNTFRTTKEYADQWSRPYIQILTELTGFQGEMGKVVIKDNVIDVYRLGMTYYQSMQEYIFMNNVITADATCDRNNCIVPYGVLADPTTGKGITVKNNIINIINRDLDTGRGSIIFGSTGAIINRTDKIVFENNYINWNGLGNIIKGSVSATSGIFQNIEMRNNNIKCDTVGSSAGKFLYFSIYAIVRDLIYKDNNIEIPTTAHYMPPLLRGGQQKVDIKYIIKSFFKTTSRSFCLVADAIGNQELLTVEALYNRVSIKCHHSAGVDDFYFDYKHYPLTGVNTVQFTKSDDSVITQGITMDNTNTSTLVKLIGTASKFTVNFINTSSNCGFDLSTTLPSDEYVSVEVTVSQCVKT